MGNYPTKGHIHSEFQIRTTLSATLQYVKLERNKRIARLQKDERSILNDLQIGTYPIEKSRSIGMVNV